ncbi:MAG: chemotaxis protein [Gallionellales bacterium GWA2_60_142]|jgi:methyl-accepting chemotaxis protein|nr:MAG: chemotaxis protein [Gallionellales bacterium GWA2_60_142]
MNKWWGDLSLKNKLQIPVQLILMLILLTGQHFAFVWFEERMLDEVKHKTALSAEVAFRGMNALMLNGEISDPERRKQVLEGVQRDKQLNLAEVRLIRGKPVQDQYGPGTANEQPQDEMDRAALSGAGPQVGEVAHAGDRATLRMVVPFLASKDHGGVNCLQCHTVPEGSINGAVSVVADVSHEYAFISRANIVLWGAQVFIQVVLFFVVGAVINHVIRPVRDLQQVMLAIQADGDLTRRAPVSGNDEIGQISRAFDALMGSLAEALRRVHAGAEDVMNTAAKLAQVSGKVTEGSLVQSEAAASTAASVEQMTVSITSVADSTEEVRRLSGDSLARTREGNESAAEMIREVRRIEETVKQVAASVEEFVQSTRSIAGMTQQVRDIADQTNLLALNAAIEAARAGEQGRGFAVVADEVRKLAEKSSQSAGEIDGVTTTLSDKAARAEEAIESGLTSLHATLEHIDRVTVMLDQAGNSVGEASNGVNDIAATVREQSQVSTQVAQHVENIARMAEENHVGIMQTADDIRHLGELAEELEAAIRRFKV